MAQIKLEIELAHLIAVNLQRLFPWSAQVIEMCPSEALAMRSETAFFRNSRQERFSTNDTPSKARFTS